MSNSGRSLAGKKGYLAAKNKLKQKQKERADEKKRLYYLSPKLCLHCHTIIPYEKRADKFCNKSCFFATKRKVKEKPCRKCGLTTKKPEFCSKKCSCDYKKIKKQEREFELASQGKQKNQRHLKKYLIFKYGEKCMICGWAEINSFTGKIPIEMHHKDGNGNNNNENNLVLLCPNHHSLTQTYRNNLGRSTRKNRQLTKKQLEMQVQARSLRKPALTIEIARIEANKFQKRKELIKNNCRAYKFLCKYDRKWLDDKLKLENTPG